jgi:hypothetical protein
MSLKDIIEYFPNYTSFELKTALRMMINESKIVTNKYGFPNYLKEEKNVFFLVSSLSDIGNYFSEYYTKNPNITVNASFTDIVNNMYTVSFPDIIREICDCQNISDFNLLIIKLPIDIQEMLLESTILAKKQDINTKEELREIILEYFKEYYQKIDGIWVSSLLYDNNSEILRCLEDNEWKDCDNDYIEKIENQREHVKEKLKDNKYGYYGQYDPDTKKFWLRSVEDDTQIKASDKRKRTRGKECKTWDGQLLTKLVTTVFNIPPPENYATYNSEQLWKMIQRGKWTKNIYPDNVNKDEIDIETLHRVAYWAKRNREEMCGEIKNFFNKNGLMTLKKKD